MKLSLILDISFSKTLIFLLRDDLEEGNWERNMGVFENEISRISKESANTGAMSRIQKLEID